jgi:hemerythrin superfamily protein
MDAIELLKQDHRDVEQLFADFNAVMDPDERYDIVVWIADALTIHAQLEETCFYPAVRAVDPDLVEGALEEHRQVKELIADLIDLDAGDARLEARMILLEHAVQAHVTVEERQLFAAVQRRCAPELLRSVAQQMTELRDEIESEAAACADSGINVERAPL